MDMAFQSNTLRNGQWVTETVSFQDALKASVAPQPAAEPRPEAPLCGILSRTVIESPVVHWALPVRLRSQHSNDIAFIGDRFVQISELRDDGQLHEVIRKSDFDYRIRNAVVLGPPSHDHSNAEPLNSIKTEDADVFMQDGAGPYETDKPLLLPPQLLILMLETGDTIFLFLEMSGDGSIQFVYYKYDSPKNLKFLGFHLSVDPTSRYLAAAPAEGAFVVYEIESMDTMNTQYMRQGSIQPVRSIHIRIVHGVIHKMEFLHPRPEDDYHIILLLIMAKYEPNRTLKSSRMIYYEWENGEDLATVFETEENGTRLPDTYKMPLLLVPLLFNTAFFAVSENSIGIVKCALEGPPQFEQLQTHAPGPTELHHGNQQPLWTAWARPFRLKSYFEKTDIIYLAREDGVVIHIEIDALELMPSVTNLGSINANISTAFTTAYDRFTDVLIIGGDSGSGGIWKLPARSDLTQVTSIPNWSPVIDMATTDEISSWTGESPTKEVAQRSKNTTQYLAKPDRIFCASGRGPKSSLTELRWGIQARIGLEFDYEEPIRQSWMFPVEIHGQGGFYALLSLPHSSEVFHISDDFDNASALTPDTSPFDTMSRTICAVHNQQGTIVQITETSTTLVMPSQSSRHHHWETLGLQDVVMENAFCNGDLVVLSSHKDELSQLHILQIDQMNISLVNSWETEGEVSCISMFNVSGQVLIVVGSIVDALPHMIIYSTDGRSIISKTVDVHNVRDSTQSYGQMEAFTSVAALTEGLDDVVAVFGTRSGHLVTTQINRKDCALSFSVERLGMAPVAVVPASAPFGGKAAIFACYDNNFVIMADFSSRHIQFKTKHHIWPTDCNDSSLPPPPIHSVFCLQQSLSGYRGHMSLMMLAGSRVLFAEIWPHVGPVPRSIPLQGTPSRVIYSSAYKCFIVAHLENGGPTLSFIDPDSGATISSPSDKDKQSCGYISGLGIPGDKIWCLSEWHYIKDGKIFPFVIVTTDNGQLLVISVTDESDEKEGNNSRHLRYWTRYKKKGFEEPIFSAVGDAEGLLFCVGKTLHWEVLDLAEKKLKPMKKFQLDSAATSLQVVNGKVCALTASHSLQVIDLYAESETTDASLIHSDQVTRYPWHSIEMGDSTDPPGKWPINLVSSAPGTIAGLWVPWRQRNAELHVVFEGKLPSNVRRFRRGHTRQLWLSAGRGRRYDSLLSTADGAEMFGVSIDGSLQHFSIIGLDLWKFLRLVQNLAHLTTEVCPFLHHAHPLNGVNMDMDVLLESQPRRDMLHINGDILKRCLKPNALEYLIEIPDGFDLFCEYLDGIENGCFTVGFRDGVGGGRDKYIELGYDILEYLLEPPL